MKKLVYFTLIILTWSCTQKGNPKFNDNPVIAHRGAWKAQGLPENSMASLKQAIKLGCHGSEFDVHLTKDDSLVVNHDDDFYGIDIETATYQELLAFKLSNGENIPTVREYMKEGLKQHGTKLIFEIKTSTQGKERSLKLTRHSVELVEELGAQNWVEYICFDYDVGKLIHDLDPKAKVAFLKADKTPAQVKKDYTGIDYQFKAYSRNPTWIKEAQNLGLTVNAWTVNEVEDMKNLLGQKVDYITTNEPELLLKTLDKK